MEHAGYRQCIHAVILLVPAPIRKGGDGGRLALDAGAARPLRYAQIYEGAKTCLPMLQGLSCQAFVFAFVSRCSSIGAHWSWAMHLLLPDSRQNPRRSALRMGPCFRSCIQFPPVVGGAPALRGPLTLCRFRVGRLRPPLDLLRDEEGGIARGRTAEKISRFRNARGSA